MAQPTFAKSYPSTAFILALIGGILILLNAIVDAAIFAVAGSVFAAVGVGGIGALFIALAVVALILGLLVLLGALMLKNHPESAKMWGILILVFSIISFVGGGGFYIGAILGLVGGILALVWNPPAPMGQTPAWGAPAAPPAMASPGWGAAPPAGGAPLAGQKFCASCGSPNAPGAQFCAKCGAAMPAQ